MDAGLDDRTLRRIIALLVSFATLADRAATRTFTVRWLVLALLRHVHSVVLDHVVDSAPWAWPYLDDELEPGNGPADAVLLGQRLRMLAAILAGLLPAEDRPDVWTAGRDCARHCLASDVLLAIVVLRGRRLAFHDTS